MLVPKPPAKAGTSERVFVVLDGLRGVAALMVALRHAPFLWTIPGPTGFLKNSYLAVDLFFVLSGFVLEHAYGRRLQNGMPATSFMLARFQRLYPLYAIAFLLAVPTVFFHVSSGSVTIPNAALEVVFGSLMLPSPNWSYPHDDLYPLNGPAWSLFFELLANFFFALAAPYLSKKLLAAIVILCGCALAILASGDRLAMEPWMGSLAGGPNWATFGTGLLRVGFSFFAGVAIYRAHSKLPITVGPKVVVTIFLVAMIVLASGFSGSLDAPFAVAAVLFVFPTLILLCAQVDVGEGGFSKMMATLGLLSYGVYVLQAPIYGIVEAVARRIGIGSVWYGLAATLTVAIVAYFATIWIDIPVRHLMKHALSRRRHNVAY